MNNAPKGLVLGAGVLLLLMSLPALLGLLIVLLLALLGEPGALELGLVSFLLLAVTFGCGIVFVFHGIASLDKRPSRQLRLPPTWALGGGFVLALSVGLGLHATTLCVPLSFPPVFLLAVALPPVVAVAWMVDGQPGALTWRRATVAFAAGASVSTQLALVLNILLPGIVLALVWGLADQALPALEGLLDALTGGDVADVLTSPGFLFAMLEIAVVAPLAEEFVKPLVTLPLLKRLDRPRDALLVGAVAGAGFAALENVLYAGSGLRIWAGILLLRAMGAGIHPLGAGLTAMGWHDLLRRKPGAARRWLERYGLAVGVHALWNGGSLLVYALVYANFFGASPPEVDILGLTEGGVLLAVLALEGAAIWVGARALARRLLPPEETLPHTVPRGREGMPVERAIAVWALVCLLVLVPVGLTMLRSVWLGPNP